jgi:hypothetical protein
MAKGGGSEAGLGWRKERDGAHRRGPHVNEKGERRQLTWKMQTRKETHIFAGAPSAHGPDGPAKEATACGKGRPTQEELGRSGRIPVKIQRKN